MANNEFEDRELGYDEYDSEEYEPDWDNERLPGRRNSRMAADVNIKKNERKNDEYKFKKGNTLDYYNEDLSRKAVGRLFEEKAVDDRSFVKGYHDTVPQERLANEEISTGNTENPDSIEAEYEQEPFEHSKDFVKGYVKVPMHKTGAQKVAYKAAGRSPILPKESVKPADTEDEESYALYRKKEKRAEPQAKPSAKATQEKKVEPKPAKKPSPKSSEPPEKEFADEDYEDFKERYKSREYIPSPNQPRNPHKQTVGDEEYDEYEVEARDTTGLKMILATVCFVFLVIMAVLVYQINLTKAQLKDAQAALLTGTEADKELQTYKIRNESLETENAQLKLENEELRSKLPVSEDDTSDTSSAGTVEQDSQGTSESEQTYVVQRGDSLSRISMHFYNSQGEYRRIMEANGLTSDTLSPGQVLKIPPK